MLFPSSKSKLLIIFILYFSAAASYAETSENTESTQTQLNEAISAVEKSLEEVKSSEDFTPPILPNPGKDKGQLIVDSSNVSYFYDIILPGMAEWVSKGSFIMNLAAKTNYEWSGADEEDSLSQSSSSEEIIQTLEKAQNQLGSSIYRLNFSWFDKKGIGRNAAANLMRSYDAAGLVESLVSKVPQVPEKVLSVKPSLSEFFFFLSPPAIYSYTQVFNRFNGEEDDIWHFSPVIGAGRPLYNANRGDAMFDSAFAMDDLFVWSANTSLLEIEFVKKTKMLVPVVSLNSYTSVPEKIEVAPENFINPSFQGEALNASILESAKSIKVTGDKLTTDTQKEVKDSEEVLSLEGALPGTDSGSSFVVWNAKSKKHPKAANWQPSNLRYVPRSVFVLEVTTKDPFYPGGRQTLVVDAKSLLPIYKVCYSRTGRYQKTIIGAWSFSSSSYSSAEENASSKNETKLRPFLASLLVVDFYNLAVAVDTEKVFLPNSSNDKINKLMQDFYNPKKVKELILPTPKPEPAPESESKPESKPGSKEVNKKEEIPSQVAAKPKKNVSNEEDVKDPKPKKEPLPKVPEIKKPSPPAVVPKKNKRLWDEEDF